MVVTFDILFFADHVDAIELPTVTDSSGKPLFTGLYSGPYFDLRRMTRNQTVQMGENALIHCAVKQSGEKSVRTLFYLPHTWSWKGEIVVLIGKYQSYDIYVCITI